MRKVLFFVVLINLTTNLILSQERNIDSFNNKILLGGDLGLTFTYSDYKNPGVGLMFRGVAEYYLYEKESQKIGLRGFAGYGLSTGSDDRYDPDAFNTKIYTLALGGIYSMQLSNSVSPYLFFGVKFFRFNPKDRDGSSLPRNASNEYEQNFISLSFELGLRYRISNYFYGYGSIVPLVTANDNIDDRASGKSNDLVVSLNLGLLYALDLSSDEVSTKSEKLPAGIKESKIEITEEPDINISESPKTEDESIDLEKITADEVEFKEESIDSEEEKSEEDIFSDDQMSTTEEVLSNEMESDESVEISETAESNLELKTAESNIIEELSQKLELGRVNFKFGETEIGRMEYVELDRLYRIIAEDNSSRWKITGYTDNIEPVQVHQSLGIQRAYFVLRYFMEKGLDRNRFEVVVGGEERPIADNSTEDGRAKNRRVEISKIK